MKQSQERKLDPEPRLVHPSHQKQNFKSQKNAFYLIMHENLCVKILDIQVDGHPLSRGEY